MLRPTSAPLLSCPELSLLRRYLQMTFQCDCGSRLFRKVQESQKDALESDAEMSFFPCERAAHCALLGRALLSSALF